MSRSDFQVPGLRRTPNGIARWIVSTAWAYSSKWNNRRLENHFHGIWNIVLHDLTDDLAPYAFVVPQYQIDSVPGRLSQIARLIRLLNGMQLN
jgi:hypothetical protein